MKLKIKLAMIILTFVTVSYGQNNETLLYNNKGQLRADTSLVINPVQLNKWGPIEDLLLNHLINSIEYSTMAMEFDLSGISIVSFNINAEGKLSEFKVIKNLGGGLDEEIKICLNEFKYFAYLAPKDKNDLTYYLAINYKLIDANTFIKKENSIPIYKVKFNYIQH